MWIDLLLCLGVLFNISISKSDSYVAISMGLVCIAGGLRQQCADWITSTMRIDCLCLIAWCWAPGAVADWITGMLRTDCLCLIAIGLNSQFSINIIYYLVRYGQ